MVGNKTDRCYFEEVTINEAIEYAKELNAIYQSTSAKDDSGIEELFNNIAKKLLRENIKINKKYLRKKERKIIVGKLAIDNNKNKNQKCYII